MVARLTVTKSLTLQPVVLGDQVVEGAKMTMKRLKYCVGNEWIESKAEKFMPIMNPSTGEQIAETPCCSVAEVSEAVESAARAFQGEPDNRFLAALER